MVNSLYWVSALVYALVLLFIILYDIRSNRQPTKEDKAFRRLVLWVIVFCLQDVAWGICAGDLLQNNNALMISSTVFHTATVTTTFFWLDFMLTYLGDRIRHHKLYLVLDGIIILFQVILLTANFFTPTIFYIGEGCTYCTAFMRPFAFMNQYIVYLVMGISMAIAAFSEKGEDRKKYLTVFFFALAPILSGVFQLLYPDGPYYSMGYFLGCFIIHIFVVLEDKDELQNLYMVKEKIENEKKMAEQILIANTDKITGLWNRRAYEEDLRRIPEAPTEENLVYVSADVNGLKVVNDTKGHAAGDELLKGASECLTRCLGSYGKVYRIGGDEFAAVIYADQLQQEYIKNDLKECIYEWRGEVNSELSVSFGFASRAEFPEMKVAELAKAADSRMYQAKSVYYATRGVDRRGQQSAYKIMCESYTKVLKVNLATDTYQIIRMEAEEQILEFGFAEKLSEWLYNFAISGQVHPEDLELYLKKTDLQYLRTQFKAHVKEVAVLYKRKTAGVYKQALMELIPSDDYSDEKQVLFLFVKNIEK